MTTLAPRLRHRVTFQQQGTERDSEGVSHTVWQNVWLDSDTELADVPAEVLTGPGREAVIAGQVYRPAANPSDGRFIYGDLCSRELFALTGVAGKWTSTRLGALAAPDLLTTLGEDATGNLYAGTSAAAGPIYRLFIP